MEKETYSTALPCYTATHNAIQKRYEGIVDGIVVFEEASKTQQPDENEVNDSSELE